MQIQDSIFQLPADVQEIIHVLEDAGYEAFAVGGCVRDVLLGRTPSDWDITTSALPEQVKALFPRTVDTGIAHGTVTVLMKKEGYEVTTYRIDGLYLDGRHPSEVLFTPELREDLRRRDFTINAMAYSPRTGLVDLYHGIEDLEKGIIRCVGIAEERFSEDALRILRAIRFAAQLGFEIESETRLAAQKLAGNLQKISAERIRTELVKLLISPYPELLADAYEMGLTAVFLPEFDAMMQTEQHNPHHCYSVGMHTIRAIQEIRPDPVLRIAMLLHDIAKPLTKTTVDGVDHFKGHVPAGSELAVKILRRLKFDNDTIARVKRLILYHDSRPAAAKPVLRRLMCKAGPDLFPDLFEVMRADLLAQSLYRREEKVAHNQQLYVVYEEILRDNECVSLKDLAVSGRDLIAAGMKPGPELGKVLQQLLDDVVETPEHNTREYLLNTLSR